MYVHGIPSVYIIPIVAPLLQQCSLGSCVCCPLQRASLGRYCNRGGFVPKYICSSTSLISPSTVTYGDLFLTFVTHIYIDLQ